MEKRDFLKACGAGFLGSLLPEQAFALSRGDNIFFSAAKNAEGKFVAAIISEAAEIIAKIPLPSRGHDVTYCSINNHAIVFARRPGTFAIVFTPDGTALTNISSTPGRHFYGHGVFSKDSKLLFATENDFENAIGMIGIYDVGANYARIGEWPSGGIGPHDIMLTNDGKHLCVANGGIETHPDFGRTKLNLSTMSPNISWIEIQSGHIVASHDLPETLTKLSLRHLSMGADQTIWFGAQNQGSTSHPHQLVGSVSLDQELKWLELPLPALASLKNYVGSITTNPQGSRIAITSPVGNSLLIADPAGNVLDQKTIQSVSGVTASGSGFAYTTGLGGFSNASQTPLQFDNHLNAIK